MISILYNNNQVLRIEQHASCQVKLFIADKFELSLETLYTARSYNNVYRETEIEHIVFLFRIRKRYNYIHSNFFFFYKVATIYFKMYLGVYRCIIFCMEKHTVTKCYPLYYPYTIYYITFFKYSLLYCYIEPPNKKNEKISIRQA